MPALRPAEVARVVGVLGRRLREAQAELNMLDGRAGDGDLGETLAGASSALEAEIANWSSDEELSLGEVLVRLGTTLRRSAPSSFGSLLAVGLRTAGHELERNEDATSLRDADALLGAFRAGVAEVEARGRTQVGDRTFLDALVPALEAAGRQGFEGADCWKAAAEGARDGARATAAMVPKVGRASWVGERAVGEEDAGAHVVALVVATMAETLNSQEPR